MTRGEEVRLIRHSVAFLRSTRRSANFAEQAVNAQAADSGDQPAFAKPSPAEKILRILLDSALKVEEVINEQKAALVARRSAFTTLGTIIDGYDPSQSDLRNRVRQLKRDYNTTPNVEVKKKIRDEICRISALIFQV